MCCFVKPGEVLLAWTDDENDPQYARSRAAFDLLSHTVDAKGRSFVIHKLPIPKHPICITEEDLLGYDFEAGEDQREAGERLAASYINFYLANHCVLLPRFGDENDTVAAEILGKCFPDRRILPVDARVILTGGGNIHCITQQIPAKKKRKQIMKNIKIAALQFSCCSQVQENIDKAETMVREAASNGANLILLPELFERPYFCQEKRYDYYDYALPLTENPAVRRFQAVAGELGVVIPVSFYERDVQRLFNSIAMIDADGSILAFTARPISRTIIFIRKNSISLRRYRIQSL